MGDAKPWQIILIVVAVVGVGFSVWRFGFGGRPDLPDSVTLVDVVSGDLFVLSIAGRRAGYYPEMHPDSNKRTLLPVVQEEDGTWRISSHSLPALEDVQEEPLAVKNKLTGEVQVSGEGRRRLSNN